MITITDEAVDQLKDFLDEQGTPKHALRVFVAPGGCSGLQYGMSIEEDADETDTIIDAKGVRLLVDEFSAMYIGGAEIDYVNSLMGGGFKIENPNAVSSCGCGSSFRTKETHTGEAAADSCGYH